MFDNNDVAVTAERAGKNDGTVKRRNHLRFAPGLDRDSFGADAFGGFLPVGRDNRPPRRHRKFAFGFDEVLPHVFYISGLRFYQVIAFGLFLPFFFPALVNRQRFLFGTVSFQLLAFALQLFRRSRSSFSRALRSFSSLTSSSLMSLA